MQRKIQITSSAVAHMHTWLPWRLPFGPAQGKRMTFDRIHGQLARCSRLDFYPPRETFGEIAPTLFLN
jgi:hypothetical protein